MPEQSFARRILLPLDGSGLATASLPYATLLASDATELVLLRVVPDPVPMSELAGSSRFPIDAIRTRHLDAARDYLNDVAGALRGVASHVEARAEIGSAPDEILRVAEEARADLIIMGTHGHGFLGRVVAGSVADRVARGAVMPVMLIHPHGETLPPRVDARARLRRILVPLDGSELARQALPVAANLARQHTLPIRLIRALPADEHFLPETLSDAATHLDALHLAITETLDAEASRLRATGLDVTTEIVVGQAAPGILEHVIVDDVVVMTSHGTGGVRRWLLGSVAEKLIRSGAAPVILVPVRERRHLAEASALPAESTRG